jgi:hypothetical protein
VVSYIEQLTEVIKDFQEEKQSLDIEMKEEEEELSDNGKM